MKTRPTIRIAVVSLATAALAGAAGTAALAKSPPKPLVKGLSAACAGDTISGKARVSGKTKLRLKLLAKASAKAKLAPTGKTRTLSAPRAGAYPFKFDISRLNAYGYRIDATKTVRSKLLLAASCGPGYQVPEAPFALLLPLSLLVTLGAAALLSRRRSRLLET